MRKTIIVLSLAAVFIGVGWWLTPSSLMGVYTIPHIPADIDGWLAESERVENQAYTLIPGTEKRILWQQATRRSRYSVVYLHGFSATRQEIAPTAELIANRLGANLFETRLAGHGRGRQALHDVRAEDWLRDGIEALAIGAQIGDDVIVIGTSTGATLALALADHPLMESVSTLVLISPNMAPADPKAAWLTRPAGPLLGRLIGGETRSWTAHNAEQERYWSTSYPSAATVEVMRLVDRANAISTTPLSQSVLMLLSPDDTVISPNAARVTYRSLQSPRKRLDEMTGIGDPSNHVLAGDILSPDGTLEIASRVIEFVEAAN